MIPDGTIRIYADALRAGDLFTGGDCTVWFRVRMVNGRDVHYTDPRFPAGLGHRSWGAGPSETVMVQRDALSWWRRRSAGVPGG